MNSWRLFITRTRPPKLLDVSVPVTIKFVTGVEPLVVVNQNQIVGLVLVIAVKVTVPVAEV